VYIAVRIGKQRCSLILWLVFRLMNRSYPGSPDDNQVDFSLQLDASSYE